MKKTTAPKSYSAGAGLAPPGSPVPPCHPEPVEGSISPSPVGAGVLDSPSLRHGEPSRAKAWQSVLSFMRKIAVRFRRRRVPPPGPRDFVRIETQAPRVLTLSATGVGYTGFEEAVKRKAAVDIAELAMKSGLIRFEIEPVEEIPGWLTVNASLKIVEKP